LKNTVFKFTAGMMKTKMIAIIWQMFVDTETKLTYNENGIGGFCYGPTTRFHSELYVINEQVSRTESIEDERKTC